MSAPGLGPASPTGVAVLADIRNAPLSATEVLDFVRDPRVGGVATFVGLVRDHAGGHSVVSLDYVAHPSAGEALTALATATAARPGVHRVAAIHRTGRLGIGEAAVVLAVGAEHRGQAFDACSDLIDRLKQVVPIWKHQVFDDGTDEWVGTP